MCCCCLPRCSIICAGVWCLIQSIAWATAALIAIFVYTCDIPVDFDIFNPAHYLYFVYFFNRDCADIPKELDITERLENMFTTPSYPGSTIPENWLTTPFPIPNWPGRFVQADYTHTLMTFYAGFNAGWAVTCCIAIVAAAMSVRNWFAYVPWILLTAANIVLDVIATINFATDAVNSQTVDGLLENVIGLNLSYIPDEYRDKFFGLGIFSSLDGFTMLPSAVMAFLTGRLGILWLLNVLFLICVPASIPRLTNKKGSTEHLTTYPHTEPRNHGFHNQSYTGVPHSNEPGPKHDYSEEHVYSRPYSSTGGGRKKSFAPPPPQPLTNGGPASSVAVPETNLHSPATQPDYVELIHPQQRYHQPSAPSDNYERQAPYGMPVPSDFKSSNEANEQIIAPHVSRTDSERYFQPTIKNRPDANIPLPRIDLHSSAPGTGAEYLGPRKTFHNSLASADNYKPPPPRRTSFPHDVGGNNGPNVQRRAPHLHRTDSGRPPYKPPASTANLHRLPAIPDEVDRHQDHNSNAGRRPSLPPEELRSQLPWSYFGPRNAPKKPKPIQESVAEEEVEKPPVPVPDYTLHFGKTTRPVASKWSDDGTSFTDSVASHRRTSASGVDRRSSLLQNNRY